MTSMETKRYEMLDRVREFGDAHADRFPASSLAREQFAAVAVAVKELSAYAVKKMSAAHEGSRQKTAARPATSCVFRPWRKAGCANSKSARNRVRGSRAAG